MTETTPEVRRRWQYCDECDCVTIIERDEGVPEEGDWEESPRCLVCGSPMQAWNPKRVTTADEYFARGVKRGRLEAVHELDRERKQQIIADATDAIDYFYENRDAWAYVQATNPVLARRLREVMP